MARSIWSCLACTMPSISPCERSITQWYENYLPSKRTDTFGSWGSRYPLASWCWYADYFPLNCPGPKLGAGNKVMQSHPNLTALCLSQLISPAESAFLLVFLLSLGTNISGENFTCDTIYTIPYKLYPSFGFHLPLLLLNYRCCTNSMCIIRFICLGDSIVSLQSDPRHADKSFWSIVSLREWFYHPKCS